MLEKQYYNAEDCIRVDKLIKGYQQEITKPSLNLSIYELISSKTALEQASAKQLCSDKIEKQRQLETALLITKNAIEQEKKVLGNSKKDENVYIGVGALILIVGLIILIKK
jgi:hypothetical protein